MMHTLVLTAAGKSTRMGGQVKKEYLTVSQGEYGRISVLSAALHSFLSTGLFSAAIITVPENGEKEARSVLLEDQRIQPLLDEHTVCLLFTEGGSTRQDSVRRGLEALEHTATANGSKPDTVMVHDGARPWVSPALIRTVLAGILAHGASVPAIQTVDTQKETGIDGRIVRHLDRSRIISVQTPQGFLFSPLLDAHRKAAGDGAVYTDDTEIWGRYAGDVWVCPGEQENKKITYQGDLT